MKYDYFSKKPEFLVDNIDLQSVSRPLNYRHLFKNGRAQHGFIYTVSGMMCDVFENGERIYSAKGELLFVPKGCVYTGIYAEENTKIEIVQFDVVSGNLPDYLKSPQKIDLPNAGEYMRAFFGFGGKEPPNHPFHYLARLYDFLYKIDETYSRLPLKYKKLKPALVEMRDFWAKNDPISYYATLCDMSEANFRRLFREYIGKSPIEYRNDIRLENAKSKLQSGEYNVSEAAEACGFSNLSFFIRLYKKKFGYTPKNE